MKVMIIGDYSRPAYKMFSAYTKRVMESQGIKAIESHKPACRNQLELVKDNIASLVDMDGLVLICGHETDKLSLPFKSIAEAVGVPVYDIETDLAEDGKLKQSTIKFK